uniref:Large ribosomal subunit protein bL17m n=1 Tax=Bubo bubo TaxID=30461 RepID=A0A8C0I9P5_BUBBB
MLLAHTASTLPQDAVRGTAPAKSLLARHNRGAGAERATPQEKDLIHKLFKVLAPRFQPHPGSYTRLLQIPNRDSLDRAKMAVIELKGNPYPPLIRPQRNTEKTLLNQLLKGYREDMQRVATPEAPKNTLV